MISLVVKDQAVLEAFETAADCLGRRPTVQWSSATRICLRRPPEPTTSAFSSAPKSLALSPRPALAGCPLAPPLAGWGKALSHCPCQWRRDRVRHLPIDRGIRADKLKVEGEALNCRSLSGCNSAFVARVMNHHYATAIVSPGRNGWRRPCGVDYTMSEVAVESELVARGILMVC